MTMAILQSGLKNVLATRGCVVLLAMLGLAGCVSSHQRFDDPCDEPRAERNPETLRCECVPSTMADKKGRCVDDPNWDEGASLEDADSTDPDAADAELNDAGAVGNPDEGLDASGIDADADASGTVAAEACVPAAEACNDLDDDCDGVVDNGVLRSLWYRDCDGDGYAAQWATATVACTMPALSQGCAKWTMRAPSTGAIDCNDGNAAYHPGADFDVADVGTASDLNCDGVVEKKWRFDAAELRLDSFSDARGFKLCDIRAPNGTLLYPESFAAFVPRGQCPCFVEWENDHVRWTSRDVPCSFQTEEDVIPISLKQLDATTCQPGDVTFAGVQRCR